MESGSLWSVSDLNLKDNNYHQKGTTVMEKLLTGNRPSPLRLAFPFTIVAVMCFAFLPLTRAVNPAPDGGYPGSNTAEGDGALFSLTSGPWNTANGFQVLKSDTTGGVNTGVGFRALFSNTTGIGNTAVGSQSLLNNVSGSNNTALGANSGSNVRGSNNIHIGNGGASADSNKIRIGSAGVHTNTFIAGIHGRILPDNGTLQPVFVNNAGEMGTVLSPPPSSARFKEQIKPMDKVSEAILALKPVTFRYKKDLDPNGVPQFGLVAEQVEKVNPDLVKRDDKGELYTVRYEAVNAMLLNEFLKEHRKVEQLEASAAQQAKEIKALTATVKEQASQIQKVSARIETSRPAPQVVVNK
jgi:hypothetical protein